MEKLEQILCGSWSRSCLPIIYQLTSSGVWEEADDEHDNKNNKWENSLLSLGCGFIRDVGWETKPNSLVGFVLAKHPKDKYFINNKKVDYCLIPEYFALRIIALGHLPACTNKSI